jgi:hypothetical protein
MAGKADGPQLAPLGFVGFNESERKEPVAWTRKQRPQWMHWRSRINHESGSSAACRNMLQRLTAVNCRVRLDQVEKKFKQVRSAALCRLTTQSLKPL